MLDIISSGVWKCKSIMKASLFWVWAITHRVYFINYGDLLALCILCRSLNEEKLNPAEINSAMQEAIGHIGSPSKEDSNLSL
jgi:hypothetical protein